MSINEILDEILKSEQKQRERNRKFRQNNPNYWKNWRKRNPIKFKKYQKKYGKTEKGKKVHRKAQAKYITTSKGKKTVKRKERRRKQDNRFINSWLWKKNNPDYWNNWRKNNPDYFKDWRKNNPDYHNNYNKTPNGKMIHRKAQKNYDKKQKILVLI